MILGASICPHPPLLLPGVCRAELGWLHELREICLSSVRRLASSGTGQIVVIGAGERSGHWGPAATGDTYQFGVDSAAGHQGGVLPLSLTVGAWLLDAVGWTGGRDYVAVARGTSSKDCMAVGRRFVPAAGKPGHSENLALLVMGDGSAKRTMNSPGSVDERAAAFDAAVVGGLASADLDALASLDVTVADELWVAGREAWQALAGAEAARQKTHPRAAPITASVRYDQAPRGVGYAVVDWSTRG